MRVAPTAIWMIGFTAYSWLATTVCAAWFARRFGRANSVELSVAYSLAWQGAVYAAWLPVIGMVWLALRRYGAGPRGVLAAFATGLAAVPLEAMAASLIDQAFTGAGGDLAAKMLARAPICILLHTAIVAVGLAAAHHRRAVAERARNALLETALSEARATPAMDTAERLMVMAGARRVPVETAAVEWFGAADNYVVVHWDGREGLMRATLQSLETRLDPRLFARAHRSALVNLSKVAEAQPLSDGSWRLTLASGAEVVTSRTYRDALLERLGR